MKKKLFLFLILLTSSVFANLGEIKIYKNDNYISKIKTYIFQDKTYLYSSEIIKKLGGKISWYSVSKKMLIQMKSHKITLNGKIDEVNFDDEVKENISNLLLIRAGKVFISMDFFLSQDFAKILGFRMEYEPKDSILKIIENINISSIRYFSYKDKTRFVIYTLEPLEYNVSQNDKGTYTISLLKGSYNLPSESILVNDGIIKNIDINQEGKSVKIIISSNENSNKVENFTLKDPDRIVFDFFLSSSTIENRIGESLNPTGIIETIKPEENINNDTSISSVPFLPDKISVEDTIKKKIIIDPGHGGKDPGGKRLFGMKEKDINLDIAKKLYSLFKKDKNFDVLITRETDVFIPLQERSKLANDYKADIFISIHANASVHRKEKGFEIYFLSEKASDPWSAEVADYENSVIALEDNNKVYDSAAMVLHSLARNEYINEGSQLAGFVSKRYQKNTPFQNRGIKQAAFYVLRGTYSPGILVESAFMTNSYDQGKLNQSKVREKIAKSIYEGVKDYAKSKGWFK